MLLLPGHGWRPSPSSLAMLPALLLLCWAALAAAKEQPEALHTLFDNLPSRIVYFEDTSIILYHDAVSRNVWRSDDEGKAWKLLQGVPAGEAYSVVEHPYDTRIAFVLSKGKTHYRSTNRGETWQSFEAPAPPAMASEVLSFHSRNWEWILYTGQQCEAEGGWLGKTCFDETYYTQDAFASAPRKLFSDTSKCLFAHSSKEVALDVPKELVYCVAYETSSASSAPASTLEGILEKLEKLATSGGVRSITDSRLFSSIDFFASDKTFVDMGIGKGARGVVGLGAIKGYIVAALKPGLFARDASSTAATGAGAAGSGEGANGDEMLLYVTADGKTWHKGLFPHGHGLRENAYTIVESTEHSILVDVLSDPGANSGTLFTSDSRGTNFVKSLEHTNRNAAGIVDFEKLESIDGVAIANVLANPEEVNKKREEKKLKTKITFDDGGHWSFLRAPAEDVHGKKTKCDVGALASCSLHLHSVTQLRSYGRIFSSTAPGIVMGVGSIGEYLRPYDECDTFVSTDAGQTWRMVKDDAHKYEFGAVGSILVMVDDEEPTDKIHYSFDFGKTWDKFDFGVTLRAKLLTTIPDSTSQKFLLLGTLSKKSKDSNGRSGSERHIVVHVDFESLRKRKCGDGDLEKWYARNIDGQPDCLMGHKQWFMRRKQDADCVVADLFKEPHGRQENCPCTDEDFECDYNYTLDGDECVLAGPQPIPAGACEKEGDKFKGSSGYRLIPGNTCNRERGLKKDAPKLKDCSEGQASGGKIVHQRFDFPAAITEHAYFGDSKTMLAYTSDNSVWQTMNEGFSWKRILESETFVASTMHAYAKERAYLFTKERTVFYTVDKGANWNRFTAPLEPNSLGIGLLDFHPTQPDWLIWTGSRDCTSSTSATCHATAYYSKDHGRNWREIDSYVRTCTWGRDRRFKIDERTIFCESYSNKDGSQRSADATSLQFISGSNFYSSKKVLFESIVGFATFEEYMVVAELTKATGALTLRVSLDGQNFAVGHFPPGMKLENQAYTVLESSTDSVFLHVTTHSTAGSEWGSLFKSNSNGTYYSMSLEHANRNSRGYVDFEKMLGLDGIALMNIVSNPEDASISGSKQLQTRITHNDGGRWAPITPPAKDSLGQQYECSGTACSLHIHGYTERADPRATFSSPTAVGLMLGVGNVGKQLAGYTDSDTFLTRDAGFTWEEVHKDAHMWEFGDQGSIILLVNDEQATDRVIYTTNEGVSWSEYVFGDAIRVRSIVTVPMDTSRKFILIGYAPSKPDATVAIHLDFTKLTNQKCRLDITDPNNDDFELWSPSQERNEQCLFGRQTLYYRRIRDKNCYIGEKLPQPHSIQRNCLCTDQDYECEFNHVRNSAGECVLIEGAQALADDGQCAWGQEFWYERTAYRKVPYSSCEGGAALDRGKRHVCPGSQGHGFFWWAMVLLIPAMLAGLVATWWTRKRSGRIRLGDPAAYDTDGGWLGTVQSIPYFLIGVGSAAWAYVSELQIPGMSRFRSSRRTNRYTAVLDDDAALLGDYN